MALCHRPLVVSASSSWSSPLPFASCNRHSFHNSQDKPSLPFGCCVLGVAATGIVFSSSHAVTIQNPSPNTQPAPPAGSQLVESLLEKTRMNKAKYDRQRLDDYYRRNYKDYFEYVEGSIRNKSEPSEVEKGIMEWLKKNN
eukprot:c21675_g1_i1 orf=224-646(+)